MIIDTSWKSAISEVQTFNETWKQKFVKRIDVRFSKIKDYKIFEYIFGAQF